MTLFHDQAEDYAISNTTLVSKDVQNIATETSDNDLFAPCMVGTLESQFLRLQMQVSGARRVLDIGTFTGMSALAMAEGLPKDGKVITLENSDDCANVAQACFDKAENGSKITLLRGNAIDFMKDMLKSKLFWHIILAFWYLDGVSFNPTFVFFKKVSYFGIIL